MKKTVKALSSFLLCILALTLLFTSCAKTDTPEETTAPQTTTVPTTTAPQETESVVTAELSKFAIVYQNEKVYKKTIDQLQAFIKAKSGVEIPVTTQIEVESEYKIIVGNFGYDETIDFYEKGDEISKSYKVVFSDNIIHIAAIEITSLELVFNDFVNRCIEKDVSTIKLAPSLSFDSEFYEDENLQARDEGDIRISSFNIANYISKSPRLSNLLGYVEAVDADIVAFQESDAEWHQLLDSKLEKKGYAQAPTNSAQQLSNVNVPVYYRSDVLELISSKFSRYSEPVESSGEYRTYMIAEFKVKSTGKTFEVVNTHLSTNDGPALKNATEMASIVKTLSNNGKTPVFYFGDLNGKCNEERFIASISLMTNAMVMPDIKGYNLEYGTTKTLPATQPAKDAKVIDHVYGYGEGYKGKQIQVLIFDYAAKTSDHLPIAFDFELT